MVPAPVLTPAVRAPLLRAPPAPLTARFGRRVQASPRPSHTVLTPVVRHAPGMAAEGELRATSDLMLVMVDRLRAAEEAKRALAPGSREFARLAYDVVEIARTVTRWSELQLRQANEFVVDTDRPQPPTLRETPKRRLDEILAEWRQAEIRLSHASPDDPEARTAAEAVDRLRDEYRELQARKLADHGEGERERREA